MIVMYLTIKKFEKIRLRELEITDLNNVYLKNNLKAMLLGKEFSWLVPVLMKHY